MSYTVKAGCIVADPPWLHDDRGARPGNGRGAANHYDTMTAEELQRIIGRATGGRWSQNKSTPPPEILLAR